MSTLLPTIKTNRGNIGNDIWIRMPDISEFERAYLSGDEASGQTVLSVLSGANFSANDYVLIGKLGAEQSEILKVSSATSSTITLSSATAYSHNQGTEIVVIPFDQIELYSATSSGGSFSLATTVSIRPDASETYIQRPSDASTLYYKARFKNSNNTTYSDYSDEVIATGFAYNTVFSIKKRALDQLGFQIGEFITEGFLNECIWEARREIDKKAKRWSFRMINNEDVGNITEGQYSLTVPTTLRDPNSPDNIFGLRIGNRGRNLTYINKKDWDFGYEGIFHTTVATQPSVGQTTLVLTNVRDFDDSGSIQIGSNTITYTSKTNSTGTLSGIPASGDGSIDATHAVGVDVWQHASFGEPTRYTIIDGIIYFEVPFSDDFEGTNLYMDYYAKLTEYDSDADVMDESDPDALLSFLKYKIKDKRENGKLKLESDPDYQNYLLRVASMVNKDTIRQNIGFEPNIGHLLDEE